MRAVSWTFGEDIDPLAIAQELRDLFRPHELTVDDQDGYARQIDRLTELVAPHDRDEFMPLQSIKANASKYGPQYRIRLRLGKTTIKGFVNRHEICFIFSDPEDEAAIEIVRRTCSRIKGVAPDVFGEKR